MIHQYQYTELPIYGLPKREIFFFISYELLIITINQIHQIVNIKTIKRDIIMIGCIYFLLYL